MPFFIAFDSFLRLITLDLEIEVNCFSKTFQTPLPDFYPTVRVRTEGESVELRNVNNACSRLKLIFRKPYLRLKQKLFKKKFLY